jgi:hypothetical protein
MIASETSWQPLGTTLVPIDGSVSIGTRLPAIGSGKPLSSSNALALLRPEEFDARMIAALQRLTGLSPAFETRLSLPNNGPATRTIIGVHWDCPADKRDEAVAIVERGLKAAPDGKIVAALYRLRTFTRGRAERSSADQEAEAVIWAEQLRCWPGDAALDIIHNWPSRENGQWWPTWHEVEQAIKERCQKRIAIANLLRRAEPGLAITSRVDPLGASATAEERERAVKLYYETLRPGLENLPSLEEVQRANEARLSELHKGRDTPLPALGEYARMSRAERAERVLEKRQ